MKAGMYDPYDRVKGGRLAFKGGDLATPIEKKKNKKRKKKNKKKEEDIDNNPNQDEDDEIENPQIPIITEIERQQGEGEASSASGPAYTIDAAKRMKYEQLFPVEAKKFGYQPKADFKSVEDALDDRVKKKADRYCK